MTRFTTLLVACVAALALTTVAEARLRSERTLSTQWGQDDLESKRTMSTQWDQDDLESERTMSTQWDQDDLARGKCSAKALNVWFSKELALARKYNFQFSDDYLTCTKKVVKPLLYQYCPTCGGDKKCIAKSFNQHFAKIRQNKKKLVDFVLSVFENADCSAAIVPMGVKVVRLWKKLGRTPTQLEVVRLLYPEANLAALGADLKRLNMMKGKPALRDEDDDIGALPAILMSPAAFKIAAIGQKIGPFIGPMKSAIMSNIRL
jgi:hypothetical protein